MQRRKPYEVHFNPIDTNIERKIVTRTIKNYNSEQKSPNIVVYPPLPKNSAIKPLGGLMTREAQYISSFQNYDIKNNQMPNDKKNQKHKIYLSSRYNNSRQAENTPNLAEQTSMNEEINDFNLLSIRSKKASGQGESLFSNQKDLKKFNIK